MERVIVTTLYVAADEKKLIAGRAPDAPPAEVTFAWLPQLDPNNIPDISDTWSGAPKEIKIDLADFLDQILRKGYYDPRSIELTPIPNRPLIEKIINEPIVIERSPPEAISISNLLKLSASPVALGTYVGIAAADGNYLLLLTVPAGILIVGTAIEVTKAIPKLLGTSEAPRSRPRSSKKRNSPPSAASA